MMQSETSENEVKDGEVVEEEEEVAEEEEAPECVPPPWRRRHPLPGCGSLRKTRECATGRSVA